MATKGVRIAMDGDAALKMIPEFSGDGDVHEWFRKLEMVCRLSNITDVETVMALRLTGRAFAAFEQLPLEKQCKLDEVKKVMVASFATTSFGAYSMFKVRRAVRISERAGWATSHLTSALLSILVTGRVRRDTARQEPEACLKSS